MYTPKPIDTSAVELPKEVEELIEKLAENNHDIWARQHMDKGWSYGPNRNDEKKEHPDFVPYRDLSESEKEYDRRTAMEAIKLIIAFGFKISK